MGSGISAPIRGEQCLLGLPAYHVSAENDLAGCRLETACDQVHRRGLAGAVGPDEATQCTFDNRHAEVIDDFRRIEVLLQILDFYDANHDRIILLR
jgi:hypothetical protein